MSADRVPEAFEQDHTITVNHVSPMENVLLYHGGSVEARPADVRAVGGD
ncbi:MULTISPECIES: hypothetical protein [Haloferax]|nr:hypothetical protein [Haloferax mediterranei]MDX5989672.1 hypothetical protein [Haloferax mediterranei ATCC 33500]